MFATLPCDQISDEIDSPEFPNALKQVLQGLGCSVEQKWPFLVDQKKITSLSKISIFD